MCSQLFLRKPWGFQGPAVIFVKEQMSVVSKKHFLEYYLHMYLQNDQ